MKRILFVDLILIASGFFCEGSSLTSFNAPNGCGDWTPFKDEKCVKIADRAGSQTQEDGEVICKAYSDSDIRKSPPKLLTVKSEEEQTFVEHFLFNQKQVLDYVWLGLTKNRNSRQFEWNDGTQLTYSNWANQTLTDDSHDCVQMESGEGVLATGLWFRANCGRKNLVVCEKLPTWSYEKLQETFLNFKLEQEWKQKELEEKIEKLEKNPMPLGYIHVQLYGSPPPTSLWPGTVWKDISPSYAGLFFRVMGEKSGQFGEIQEGTSPRLTRLQRKANVGQDYDTIDIPPDGSWSGYTFSGSYYSNEHWFFRLRVSTEEVRPRNQAVIVWQRVM